MEIWKLENKEIQKIDPKKKFTTSAGLFAIRVNELTTETVDLLHQKFGIHPISFQDFYFKNSIGIEDYGDYYFLTCFSLEYAKLSQRFSKEKVGICFGDNFIIVFTTESNEQIDELFENEAYLARIMSHSAFYCASKVLKILFSSYEVTLNQFYNEIDNIEKQTSQENDQVLTELIKNKKLISFFYRTVIPNYEILNFLRDHLLLINEDEQLYKELSNKLDLIVNTIKAYRDIISSIQESYISLISHKTNKAIKVLTIITAILSPMMLISSIFGMNLAWLPLQDTPLGFLFLSFLMSSSGIILWVWLKKKKLL